MMPGRPMVSRLGPEDRRKAIGRRPADRARRKVRQLLTAIVMTAISGSSVALTNAVWESGAEATEAYWNAYVASCIHRMEQKR